MMFKVKFSKAVKQFVGVDGKSYGPYEKGASALIPLPHAMVSIKKDVAKVDMRWFRSQCGDSPMDFKAKLQKALDDDKLTYGTTYNQLVPEFQWKTLSIPKPKVVEKVAPKEEEEGNLQGPKAVSDLISQDLPDIEYWVYPLIPKNVLMLIGGRPAAAKSLFALSLSIAMTKSMMFLDRYAVNDTPRVLLYDIENSERVLYWRTKYILEGYENKDLSDNFLYLHEFNKNNIEMELACAMDYDIIILDSYRRIMKGDINTDEVTDRFYHQFLKPLRDAGKTVIIVHHFRKKHPNQELSVDDIQEMFRGSGDIVAQVDYALGLFKSIETRREKGLSFDVSVYNVKNRLGVPQSNFKFGVDKDDEDKVTTMKWLGEKVSLSPRLNRMEKVKELIAAGTTTRREILKAFSNVSRATVDRLILDMVEYGDIVKIKKGLYDLPTLKDYT